MSTVAFCQEVRSIKTTSPAADLVPASPPIESPNAEENKPAKDCCICMDKLGIDQGILRCKHAFCWECIEGWSKVIATILRLYCRYCAFFVFLISQSYEPMSSRWKIRVPCAKNGLLI
jgi:hypothetical protein